MGESLHRETGFPTAIIGTPLESYSPLMHDMARIIENSTDAYGSPLGSSPPYPGMAQAEEDARAMLMYGEISPEAFGDFLEAAAEKERIIRINPKKVVYRHTTAGSLLIFIIVAALTYTVYSQLKARRKIKTVSHSPGKLKAHYVLLFIGPAMVMYLVFSLNHHWNLLSGPLPGGMELPIVSIWGCFTSNGFCLRVIYFGRH